MKENLSSMIRVRISDNTLVKLQNYCAEREISVSAAVRNLITEFLEGDNENEHCIKSENDKSK